MVQGGEIEWDDLIQYDQPRQFSAFNITSQDFTNLINSVTIANHLELPDNSSEFYPTNHTNVSVLSAPDAHPWRMRSSTVQPC